MEQQDGQDHQPNLTGLADVAFGEEQEAENVDHHEGDLGQDNGREQQQTPALEGAMHADVADGDGSHQDHALRTGGLQHSEHSAGRGPPSHVNNGEYMNYVSSRRHEQRNYYDNQIDYQGYRSDDGEVFIRERLLDPSRHIDSERTRQDVRGTHYQRDDCRPNAGRCPVRGPPAESGQPFSYLPQEPREHRAHYYY
jgi:hypothetical protein